MIHTPRIKWQVPSSVSHTYFEAGMALQDPAKDETGNRYGRFKRMADDIDQIIIPHAFPGGAADWMDEEQNFKLFRFGKKRLEARVIKVYSIDVSGNLDCPQAQLLHYPLQFLYGLLYILERHGSHPHKTGGISADDLSYSVVLQAGELRPELARSPVVVLVRRR